MIIGFPGNVGDPASSLKMTGSGATGTANSGMIRRPRVCGRTGTKCRRSKVSPSEGNEARREGSQEVTASHSSREAGERPFRTPWSEGDAALWTGSWNHAEVTVPHQRVTAKRPGRARDSDTPQRDEPDALMCTSGSVGAPGSNPWGDPVQFWGGHDGRPLRRSTGPGRSWTPFSSPRSRTSTTWRERTPASRPLPRPTVRGRSRAIVKPSWIEGSKRSGGPSPPA
jgi:hypothetical protein